MVSRKEALLFWRIAAGSNSVPARRGSGWDELVARCKETFLWQLCCLEWSFGLAKRRSSPRHSTKGITRKTISNIVAKNVTFFGQITLYIYSDHWYYFETSLEFQCFSISLQRKWQITETHQPEGYRSEMIYISKALPRKLTIDPISKYDKRR